MIFELEVILDIELSRRPAVGNCGGFHTRQRGEPLERAPPESRSILLARIAWSGQRDRGRENAFGVDTNAHSRQAVEAHSDQDRGNDQRRCEHELGGNKASSQTLRRATVGAQSAA